jgi:LDH2 family malate/lactate/ureidoglycolate dehydrogenase
VGHLLIPTEHLVGFITAVLIKAGLTQEDAAVITDSLIFADLRGIASHGVVRLTSYLERVEKGVMDLNPAMPFVRDYPASALLDAKNGFGQLAGVRAMDKTIEKARACGIGAVAVRNSNHFGVAAFFAMRALQKQMIGVALTNASPGIAPFRAKAALVGTNPIAIAIPAAREKPVVLDMASSVVARGKIRLAQLAGKRIPLDWALDANGKPTDDPTAALKGTMAAIAGPKGSGLSLMIDLLTGVLTGSSLTGDVRNITDTSGPCQTGHLFLAIDPSKFGDVDEFLRDVDQVVRRIKALESVDGGPIYLPGELELLLETQRRAEGIPLDAETQASLASVAERYGVPVLTANA